MSDKVKSTFEIKLKVGLDEEKLPIDIQWEAENNPNAKGAQACKGMLLSVFDEETKDTLKIDLWTKDMQVVEMDRFMFQTLRALADTYYKATQNSQLASAMQQFVTYFGEQTEIIPKNKNK
jgi:gliding motility-associated protein GldC